MASFLNIPNSKYKISNKHTILKISIKYLDEIYPPSSEPGRVFPYTKVEGTWASSLKLSEPPGLHLWVKNTSMWYNETRCSSKGS